MPKSLLPSLLNPSLARARVVGRRDTMQNICAGNAVFSSSSRSLVRKIWRRRSGHHDFGNFDDSQVGTQRANSFHSSRGTFPGAEADAAAKSDDKGGAASAAGDLAKGVEVFQITKSGLALQATLNGTKYWKDSDLN
jgi:hypothetical protein